MTNKTTVNIKDSISDTLFIPLYMRAKLTKMKSPIIVDNSAVELCERLDYDFSKYDNVDMSLTGCGVRADYFDRLCVEEIQKSSKNNRKLVVVCIGCGLDNRLARVKNHLQASKIPQNINVDWYEMDLPEVIELRKELLPIKKDSDSVNSPLDTIHHQHIDDSLLEDIWLQTILEQSFSDSDGFEKSNGIDFLFIIEGVLMYFPEPQVKDFFQRIANLTNQTFKKHGISADQDSAKTPNITLGFDTTGSFGVKTSRKHDAIKHADTDVTFKWAVDDVNVLHEWHEGYQLRLADKIMLLHKNEWSLPAKLIRLVPTFGNNSRVLVYDLN